MKNEEYQRMFALEDTHWWFLARRDLLENALNRFPSPPLQGIRRILDLGCGTGGTLDRLRNYGRVVGLDSEPLALDYCRQRGYSDLITASATNIPFDSETFHAVVALDVLEHIPDDTKAASEIARVLKSGGRVYVTVPAYRSLWSAHDVALMHQRRYTATELRQLLTQAGLEIVYLTYTVSLLFPIVWLIRKLRRDDPNQPPKADVVATSPRINSILRWLLHWEAVVALRVPLPFGVSLFAVARKSENHSLHSGPVEN